MTRHFKQLKVSTSITMIWVLLIGLLVGAIIPAVNVNAEAASPTIAGKNIQLTLTANNSQQQVDWQMKFKATDQLAATRFKIEAANQKVIEIKQAAQVIKADTNGYFELTKAQLQDVTFTAPLKQNLKVTIDSKVGTATDFVKEGEGTYDIAATATGIAYLVQNKAAESSVNDSTSETSLNEINDEIDNNSKSHTSQNEVSSSTATSVSSSKSSSDGATVISSHSKRNVNNSSDSQAHKTSEISSAPQIQRHKQVRGSATGSGAPTIPEGAITLGNVFAAPNQQGTSGSTVSNATVTQTIQNPSVNAGQPYDEIMFGGQHVSSSIYSNIKLDFNKSFNNRTFVNFGKGDSDGFAFVMQNDPGGSSVDGRTHQGGTKALTVAWNDSDGQNLGVAGGGSMKSGMEAYRYGVQNSFAVGFDFHANTDVNSNAFDVDADPGTPHMAYAFPGTSSSYSSAHGFLGIKTNRAVLKHNATIGLNGAVSTSITDSTWYEFHFSYNASTQVFSYSLINPITKVSTTPVTISYSNLAGPLNLSANGNKAYWGFSAANGENIGQTKIAFAELPDNVKLNLTNDVTKTTDNNSIVVSQDDTTKVKYLNLNETGKLISSFKYTDGDTTQVLDQLQLKVDPDVVDLNSLSNLTATLNGVPLTGVTVTHAADGTITLKSANKISIKKNDIVQINIGFQPVKTLNVDTKTNFTSTILLHNQDDPTIVRQASGPATYFWIRSLTDVKLSWPTADNTQPTDATIVKDKKLTLASEPTDDNTRLTFYYKSSTVPFVVQVFENNTQVGSLLTPTANGSQDWRNQTMFNIPKSNLSWGVHTFKVVAYNADHTGNITGEPIDTLTLTIAVDGTLSMALKTDQVDNSLLWTKRKVGQSKGVLKRDTGNDIQLTVTDHRLNKAADWYVTAQQVGVSSQFSLQWQDINTGDLTKMLNNPITVLTPATSAITTQQSWPNNVGVLLDSPNYLSVGNYNSQGSDRYYNPVTVQWTLSNTADAS